MNKSLGDMVGYMWVEDKEYTDYELQNTISKYLSWGVLAESEEEAMEWMNAEEVDIFPAALIKVTVERVTPYDTGPDYSYFDKHYEEVSHG